MTNNYINALNERNYKHDLKECVIFGQTLGLILTLMYIIDYLSIINIGENNILKILAIIGSILFLLGVVCPYLLYYPNKIFKYITNKIFNLIFSSILIIIYVLLILPIGVIIKNKWRKKYKFYYWDSKENIEFEGFSKKQFYINLDSSKNNKFRIMGQIIGYFVSSKQYTLLPIILILIVLGIIFFFITSSVISPMIYTLF